MMVRSERVSVVIMCVLLGCSSGDGDGAESPVVGPPEGDGAGAQTTTSDDSNVPGATDDGRESKAAEGGAGSDAPVTTPGDGVLGDDPVGDPVVDAPSRDDDPATTGCGLDSGFAGDELCIPAPPPDQGFQIHIGPEDYDNPDPQYVLEPGDETNDYFTTVSGNDTDILYYYRQYRMRPGSHHMIVTDAGDASPADTGRRLGGSQNTIRDNPEGGVPAPENEGLAIPLGARRDISVNLHFINTGDQPIIQEAWVNFWYVDADKVTETPVELYAMGGLGMAIQPGADTILGPYACEVDMPGRVLSMYGHRHANAPRFSAYRVRNGTRELVYESLNWREPNVLEFSSTVENTVPNREAGIEGGWTGILDLQVGDVLEWECHVVNETDGVLRHTNETYAGEMCILIGDAIGPRINCRHF